MNNIIKYLAEAGQRAPSADNSQPWAFISKDQELHLLIDLEKIKSSCFNVTHPAILLAMGTVIENILQAAEWIGVVIGFDYCFNPDNGYCAIFHIPEKNNDLPENAMEHPLFARGTNRLPFINQPIPMNIQDEITGFSTSNVQISFFQCHEDITQWSKWIRTASEMRFQTPDLHEWFGQSLNFTPEEISSNEGLNVNTLGLPAIGKIFLKATQTWERMKFLNKFGAYKLIAQMEANNIKKSPALIGFAAPLNNDNAIETGRLMERVWIKLNEVGLSVHPYFVIPDQMYRLKQQKVAPEFIDKLQDLENQVQSKIQNEFLYMLLRVGYCEKHPVKSRRRPINFQ